MTPTAFRPATLSLARFLVLLVLFAALRRVRLRHSIEVVVPWAHLGGTKGACTAPLPSILPDRAPLRIVPAIVPAIVHGFLNLVETNDPAARLPMPAAEDVARWLPTASQVIPLARRPDP
jgi:hypothetical protein